jgi:hydrogenase expression/formation protein HypE
MGLDPIHVANEGTFITIVSPDDAERVIGALSAHEVGTAARAIGQVTDAHPGRVVARTTLGAARIVERALGEQLPRIC